MEYVEFRAMNTNVVLGAEGRADALADGFARAEEFVHASEARFTRFSQDSELARLNRAAGAWFEASPELYEVMREAYAYVEETDGLFDPAILDDLERAGYDRSMDEIRTGLGASIHDPRDAGSPIDASVDADGGGKPRSPRPPTLAIEFDEAAHAIRLPMGLRLDLGGIAKGWIAERAARVLAEFSSACLVSAGGDLFSVGLPEGQTAWEIGLEDPNDPQATLAVLHAPSGAVATSSITKRRWRQGAREQHHLIDPRTGAPAVTDWLSVTVFAPHATTAEVFAKTLLIAGSHRYERIALRRDDIAFLAADRLGRVWGSWNAPELFGVELGHA